MSNETELMFTIVCNHCEEKYSTNCKINGPRCLNCNKRINNEYIKTPTKKYFLLVDEKGLFGLYGSPLAFARGERDFLSVKTINKKSYELDLSEIQTKKVLSIKDIPSSLNEYILKLRLSLK